MSVASELECDIERAAAPARLLKTPLESSIDSGTSAESIRSRSRFGGFGLLSLAAMTLAALRGARAAEPNVAILDDDHITYKELDHGKFELVTKEAIPRHIIVDDPGETVVVKRSGSSMSVNPVDNNATRMEELSKAQQDALANYEKGMGETGSSAPPFSEPGLLEPINFIQSDDPEATQTALAPVPVFVFTSVVVPIVQQPPPPPPPPPTLEITEIGGQIGVATNDIINVARADSGVQITGTTSGVEDARIVTVTIVDSSGRVVYSGTAPVANNTWSINLSPAQAKTLADGMDTLTAVVTNAAGDSAQASHAIRVDETPPTIAIDTTVSNNVVNVKVASAGFAIVGTTTDAENGQPVTVKIVDSSGQVVDTFATTLTNNTWSVNVTSAEAKSLHDGTYTVTADVSDSAGNPAQEATQVIAVDETPPTVTWLPPAECGLEGKAIALGSIAATANSVPGHSNSVQSLIVSGIPVGAVLTDGTHCFIATSGDTSVDVKSWNLSNLKITPPNDTNFTLTVTATDQDANTASANELVTVAPLAPTLHSVAAHGNEDTAIALDLGAMARSLSGADGDASPNSLATLVVSDIPAGATLSDGTGLPGHSFTATAANTSFDVANWNLSCLKISAPAEFEGCFTLTIAATDRDSEGNISATVTATEVVTVAPVAEPPTACAPATLTLYENANCVAITGVRVGPLAEDADDTVRATLTVSHGTLHVASLRGVTVTGDDCATLTLSGSAAAVNALLAGLTYTPTCEYEGCDTLHLSVTSRDGYNTYPGVATASTSITVRDRDDWWDGVVPTLAASTFTGIDGGSGTEISAPPAASGTVTRGTTGEIAAASATAADFASASGTNAGLVPGNFQNFTRQVTVFTGDSAALNTGDTLADMIMGGFGAVLLTGGNGGNGDTIAGEHWAHSLGGHSTDDHFAFLSTDHGADRWQVALAVAAQPTDRGTATAHDHGTAVTTVSAEISSDAASGAHDKRTSQASDQSHTLGTDRNRMELSDHSGSIRDDEGGRHSTESTDDDAATVPADVGSSVKPQHALQTETVAAPNPPTDLDKADAPANGSGTAPTPNYLIHTANTAAPDVPEVNAPDTPDMKTDIHSNTHGLMLGHEWTQSSRGDWQFNFSWKSDDSAHAADAGMANMNASMHGGDAFHFDLSSMTHETSAAGDTFGHHSNEENSDAAQPPADHFHATHHASHDFIV